MRIGISTSVIQRGKTGVAQYLFALLRGFYPFTKENRFVLFVLEEDRPLFEFAKRDFEIVTVPETFRPPVKNIVWHQTQLPKLVQQHALEVLHIPSYRRMLWRRPCGLVATIHDLAPFHVSKKYDWKRMLYGRIVARRLAHRQNRIVAISENTRRDILTFFGVPPDSISVVHNGLEHDRFTPGPREVAAAAIRERHRITHSFFLYLARLEHPGKNHVRLISAFEKFKGATHSNWQLVFGGSDWSGAEVIHAAIKQSRFSGDIRCLGFVPDESLPDLYRAADAFVYPSLYEGFGMPPIEAMACGCPVISSTRGSLGEVVGDAAAIVDPEDVDSMAQQLFKIGTDAEARNRLKAAGLIQAKKFDWRRTAEQTMNVYQQAARDFRRPNS